MHFPIFGLIVGVGLAQNSELMYALMQFTIVQRDRNALQNSVPRDGIAVTMLRESPSSVADGIESALRGNFSKRDGPEISIIILNASAHNYPSPQSSATKGFPSLSLFKDGKWKETYQGSLGHGSIISWIIRSTSSRLSYLSTVEQLTFFKEGRNKTAIAYFPSVDIDILEAYRWLSRQLDALAFAYTSERELGEELGVDQDAIIVTINDEWNVLTTNLDVTSELYRSITFLLYPRPLMIDELSIQDVLSSPFPILIVYSGESDTVIDSRTKDAVRDTGLLLSIADCDSTDPVVDNLSIFLGQQTCPSLWLLEEPRNADSAKFFKQIEAGGVLDQNILEFVSEYSQKQLNRFIKSDPIEAPSQHEARVVVGSEWSSFVQSDKPKILLLYASWCSHCLAAIDLIDDLAIASTGRRHYVIAKMDKATNDSPDLVVEEFPTILFLLPRTLASHQTYSGPITKERVSAWITDAVPTAPYVVPDTTRKPTQHDEL